MGTGPMRDEPSLARKIVLFPLVRIIIGLGIMAGISFLTFAFVLGRNISDGVAELVLAASALIGLMFVGKVIERRPSSGFGFPKKDSMRHLALGFLIGAGMLTLVVGIMFAAGWYRVAGVPNKAFTGFDIRTDTTSALVIVTFFFLLVAVFEETFSRGIILRVTEEGLGSWAAVAISSFMFGAGHLGNPNSGWLPAIAITVEAGIVLGAAFLVTRDLWMPIGIHWAWNLFEGPVYGTVVSGRSFSVLTTAKVTGPHLMTGGGFGPEAGLVAVVVGTLSGIALLIAAHRKGNIRPPSWVRKKVERELNASSEQL